MNNSINIETIVCVVLLSLMGSMVGGAVPANPSLLYMEQPGGYAFQAKLVGDERISWFETVDGYSIVRDNDGWWTYAQLGDKHDIVASKDRVKADGPDNPLKRHLSPVYKEQVGMQPKGHPASERGASGTAKVLTLLINFTDKSQSLSHTPAYYNSLLFNTSMGAKSVHNYYKEVSYSKLNTTGTTSKWYNSFHTMSYYGADSSTGVDDANVDIFELAREAVLLADNDIDFSQYDSDGDGTVDNLVIVHAGNDQASTGVSTDIWSHRWTIYTWTGREWVEGYMTNDGVKVAGYMMLAENSPVGTFAHEFGHNIGLPDLYNTDSGSPVVSKWDLMDTGSWNDNGNTPAHLSAWSKAYLRWVKPVNASSGTKIVEQLESDKDIRAYKIFNPNIMPSTEYFLVENRQLVGYDMYLPEAGILIWHIDESRVNISQNNVNNGKIKRVIPEDATNGAIPYLLGAAFSKDDNETTFTPTTLPNSNTNNGTPSNISIYNIGTEGSSMNFSVLITDMAPALSVGNLSCAGMCHSDYRRVSSDYVMNTWMNFSNQSTTLGIFKDSTTITPWIVPSPVIKFYYNTSELFIPHTRGIGLFDDFFTNGIPAIPDSETAGHVRWNLTDLVTLFNFTTASDRVESGLVQGYPGMNIKRESDYLVSTNRTYSTNVRVDGIENSFRVSIEVALNNSTIMDSNLTGYTATPAPGYIYMNDKNFIALFDGSAINSTNRTINLTVFYGVTKFSSDSIEFKPNVKVSRREIVFSERVNGTFYLNSNNVSYKSRMFDRNATFLSSAPQNWTTEEFSVKVIELSEYLNITPKTSLKGDINGDCKVDYKDLAMLGAAYGTSKGDAGYNAKADLNGDDKVDYRDLAILGANYGKTC